MYEKKHHPLANKKTFYVRVGKSFLITVSFLGFSLGIGVFGYHFIGHLGWINALENASMILGGMGPVDPIDSNAGKIFASFYALYSGISFLTSFSILMAPVLHRVMHKFHLENTRDQDES